MPLHDWADDTLWSGVHMSWLTELLRQIKPQLPDGYRAYTATLPYLLVGFRNGDPDVKVTRPPGDAAPLPTSDARPAHEPEPDAVGTTVALPAVDRTLFVEHLGRMVAAVELVSPANKDRPDHRAAYGRKYLGYLLQHVHLMVIDVLPAPRGFSFVDVLADGLQLADQPPTPAPAAASYRVTPGPPGEPADYELWRRPLAVGRPLPALPLPIGPRQSVDVDLEGTYMRAAADVYLA